MTRRLDPVWVVLVVKAIVLGIWLGATAVDVSPIVTEAPLGIGRGPG